MESEFESEWVIIGYAAAAVAVLMVLVILPELDLPQQGLVAVVRSALKPMLAVVRSALKSMLAVVRSALKPMLAVVPFCLFLLMDIYWKYETRVPCECEHCTPAEHLRHQHSTIKSQRNAILIAAALFLYWLLFAVTGLEQRIQQLADRIEKIKRHE